MTSYEYAVKSRLLQIEKTQEWLAGQIRERNNCYMDGSQLRRIIKGKVKSPRTVEAINDILELRVTE